MLAFDEGGRRLTVSWEGGRPTGLSAEGRDFVSIRYDGERLAALEAGPVEAATRPWPANLKGHGTLYPAGSVLAFTKENP